MPGPYLEARLAIGEIELAQGRNAQGQRDLSSLHQEALASGFVAIAAKAAVAK